MNEEQFSIDHDKDKGRLVRLLEAETGCSVSDLLRLAEDGEVLIFAALRPFSAVSTNTQGERHPMFGCRQSSGEEVELLPTYARTIERFGSVEIDQFPADLPNINGDDDSLWRWRLEKPQTISVENLFIADGHVSVSVASSGTTEKAAPPVPVVTPAGQNITPHKLKKNTLDVPIEKAIKQAGSRETAAVWLKLKELALAGEAPFTGTIDGPALCYTNDDNQTINPDGSAVKFSKAALRKRLEPRRKVEGNGG